MSTGLLAAILGQGGAAPPAGGFPQILATASYGEGVASATSHVITLPSGIVSGEKLVMILRHGGSGVTVTPAAGWTDVVLSNPAGLAFIERTADGSEGATATFTLSASRKIAVVTMRISPVSDRAFAGNTTTTPPNPASLSPSWGADDTLWLAIGSTVNNDVTVDFTSNPTGFTTVALVETTPAAGSSSTVDCQLLVTSREENVATLAPSAFGVTGTTSTPRALHIALQP